MKWPRWLVGWTASAAYLIAKRLMPGVYAQDGLITVHDHAWLHDPAFLRAYERGVTALDGHEDYRWHWRIHVGLWAAAAAVKLDGDFVECGVNRGFLSSAIMEHLDWDTRGRTFYLLDTFAGLDSRFVSQGGARAGRAGAEPARARQRILCQRTGKRARQFLAVEEHVAIIVGAIPETLSQVDSKRIAYLASRHELRAA